MKDDRPGDSPLAYRQWDDNPTWCLDRGRDDRHMDPPDEPIEGPHVYSNFHAAILNQKEKHAQANDAAIAFLGFKKAAGLMQAAKSLGGLAMKHPHAAGAAIGAGAGAIAGGPNHRLSGAAVGAGLGAGAGHIASKQMASTAAHGAHDAANAASLRRELSPGTPAAAPHGPVPKASQTEVLSNRFLPQTGAETGGIQQVRNLNTPSAVPAPGSVPNTGAMLPWQENTPAAMGQNLSAHPGMAGGVAPRSAYKARAIGSGNDPFAGMPKGTPVNTPESTANTVALQKHAVGPAPGQAPKNKTVVSGPLTGMPKEAKKKIASLPSFPVAVDSKSAALSGGSSAKIASLVSEMATEGMSHVQPRKSFFPTSAVIGVLDDAEIVARRKVQEAINRHTNLQHDQNPEEPHVKVATPIDSTPLFDAKQRAADRFPEKITPVEAIRTDFKSALHLLQDKVREIGQKKHELAGANEKVAADPTASITTGRAILERLFPKQVLTAEGAGAAIGGGLLGAGMGYLGSRPKKEHGGRSDAEVATEAWKNRQPEKPDGVLPTIGKHVANLHADVAEQMRKHPVASTALGGAAGATIALRLAALAGLGSHLK